MMAGNFWGHISSIKSLCNAKPKYFSVCLLVWYKKCLMSGILYKIVDLCARNSLNFLRSTLKYHLLNALQNTRFIETLHKNYISYYISLSTSVLQTDLFICFRFSLMWESFSTYLSIRKKLKGSNETIWYSVRNTCDEPTLSHQSMSYIYIYIYPTRNDGRGRTGSGNKGKLTCAWFSFIKTQTVPDGKQHGVLPQMVPACSHQINLA